MEKTEKKLEKREIHERWKDSMWGQVMVKGRNSVDFESASTETGNPVAGCGCSPESMVEWRRSCVGRPESLVTVIVVL